MKTKVKKGLRENIKTKRINNLKKYKTSKLNRKQIFMNGGNKSHKYIQLPTNNNENAKPEVKKGWFRNLFSKKKNKKPLNTQNSKVERTSSLNQSQTPPLFASNSFTPYKNIEHVEGLNNNGNPVIPATPLGITNGMIKTQLQPRPQSNSEEDLEKYMSLLSNSEKLNFNANNKEKYKTLPKFARINRIDTLIQKKSLKHTNVRPEQNKVQSKSANPVKRSGFFKRLFTSKSKSKRNSNNTRPIIMKSSALQKNVFINKIPEQKYNSILFDGKIKNIVPSIYKHKITKDEANTLFQKIGKLLTAIPSLTFYKLLDIEPYKSCIDKKQIYIDEDAFSIPYVGSVIANNFEIKHTIYRCYNENNTSSYEKPFINYNDKNVNLGHKIVDFHMSNENIYVGFIKLKSKHKKLETAVDSLFKVSGHINCFIINKTKKELIFYEPKGRLEWSSIWCKANVKDYLLNSIDINYPKYVELKNFISNLKVIDTSKISGITPQWFDIYCQTYSVYAALLYCMNLNKLPQDLFRTMSLEKAKVFQKYISDNLLNTLQTKDIDMTKQDAIAAAGEEAVKNMFVLDNYYNNNSSSHTSFESVNLRSQ